MSRRSKTKAKPALAPFVRAPIGPAPKGIDQWRYRLLSPQARTVLTHLVDAGTITQREAMMDHSVQSLTKRISELRAHGFNVDGRWKTHPITGQRYMRYSFAA